MKMLLVVLAIAAFSALAEGHVCRMSKEMWAHAVRTTTARPAQAQMAGELDMYYADWSTNALDWQGSLEAGLRVKFDIGTDPNAGTSYFFNVSRTVSEAKADGWRQARRPGRASAYLPELTMYCPPSKILCALYDDLDDVAGLQIALPKADTTNALDWEKRGFQTWNTSIDGQCVFMYAIQQYFVSAEYMQKSRSERLALRDPTRVLQENAVWLTGIDRQLTKVSSGEQIVSQNFTTQSCIPWMGQHYYYNMSKETLCEAEYIYPWFPMTLDGELIATGFMTFATLPVATPDYFERPARAAVEQIVPNGSECFYDLVDSAGALTMHVYYTSTPWLITC